MGSVMTSVLMGQMLAISNPGAPSYLNSGLPGYVTIGYVVPSSHYLSKWSPRVRVTETNKALILPSHGILRITQYKVGLVLGIHSMDWINNP